MRAPLPTAPGRPARSDDEYQREGTCNLFVVFQPETGWREVVVTDRRTTQDFAYLLKRLVDETFPDAEVIRLVPDNLNTHKIGSLYDTFPPAEARQIARKLEWHPTPVHGSWLNMVEIELGLLLRQCLDRRLATRRSVQQECAARAPSQCRPQDGGVEVYDAGSSPKASALVSLTSHRKFRMTEYWCVIA